MHLTSGIKIRQMSQLVPCSRISGAIVTVAFPSTRSSGPTVEIPSRELGRRQVLATHVGSGTMSTAILFGNKKSPQLCNTSTCTRAVPVLAGFPRTIFDEGRIQATRATSAVTAIVGLELLQQEEEEEKSGPRAHCMSTLSLKLIVARATTNSGAKPHGPLCSRLKKLASSSRTCATRHTHLLNVKHMDGARRTE